MKTIYVVVDAFWGDGGKGFISAWYFLGDAAGPERNMVCFLKENISKQINSHWDF